jgi:two-component system chemotaxis response regulator CheB
MPGHDIIVMGASAGGVESLADLVPTLSKNLAASVFVVVHVAPQSRNLLPAILQKSTALKVSAPEDKTPIEPGRIYIARADHHMLLEEGTIRIIRGPKENRHRPAIDPLFRSAAWVYGPRVVGVVLSGALDDGTAGLWAIKTCGGVTIVQDPAEAIQPDMPRNALDNVEVDHCLKLDAIGPLLNDLAAQPVRQPNTHTHKEINVENGFTTMENDIKDMNQLGHPSAFTCPSCRGALWELREGQLVRYRCHTGHAFSSESLLAEQSEAIEDALFSAVRALEEKATAMRSLAGRFTGRLPRQESEYKEKAQALDQSADVIRDLIANQKTD